MNKTPSQGGVPRGAFATHNLQSTDQTITHQTTEQTKQIYLTYQHIYSVVAAIVRFVTMLQNLCFLFL